MRLLLVLLLLLSAVGFSVRSANADDWKAGTAKINITPARPIWLTGFAARTNVSQGKLHDLYVKALALEDVNGRKAVLITSDLLGFPDTVSKNIARDAELRYGLSRDRLLLNSSHTHGAPSLASPVQFIYGPKTNPEQWREIEKYTRELEGKVVELIGLALNRLEPAQLSFAQGHAPFGVNRRKMTSSGLRGFTPNPEGPVDQSVPVLRVSNSNGRMIAVVFGYAAHPTTITTGPHFYDFSADYPGFTQEMIEKEHPGVMALFIQGCGGDVMVYPRGSVELAREYGSQLHSAVGEVLNGSLKRVRGPLTTVFDTVAVEFARPPDREKLEEQTRNGDLYHRWHAREMLKRLDTRNDLDRPYPYPLGVWRFGQDLTLVAMAGEVVADYSLRLKKELPEKTVWVAGYSNDLCAYIPSRRVLEEGGYEGGGSMTYYMHPAPFAPSVEETIVKKVHELVGKTAQ